MILFLLVENFHRNDTRTMGDMAAFIPSRGSEADEVAISNVKPDEERKAGDGFDGTRVAHPALIPIAEVAFDKVLGDEPNQESHL